MEPEPRYVPVRSAMVSGKWVIRDSSFTGLVRRRRTIRYFDTQEEATREAANLEEKAAKAERRAARLARKAAQ